MKQNNELGRIQPQARDLECAVLGAILIEKSAVSVAISKINNENIFYDDRNKRIYTAILKIFSKGEPVDLLTVVQQLRETNELETVGGAEYIVELTNKVNSSANMEFHINIIIEAWVKRSIIAQSATLIEKGYDHTTDCFELLETAQMSLLGISESLQSGDTSEGDKILGNVISDMENAMKGIKPELISSGFVGIDNLTNGGWGKQELIILGARPAMGKTALALAFALNAVNNENVNVGVFSLEMSKKKLIGRILSMESKVDSRKIKNGKLSDDEQAKILHVLKNNKFKNIKIDDTAGLTIGALRSKAINMKAKWDIGLIVVDYLQLITGSGKKTIREQEISEISRTLKLIAKELDIPVIALSQLSRDIEKRQDKRPMMSDLRESGAIEQDADLIMFIYRDEYYGITEDQEGLSTAGIAEALIEKNREGDTGFIRLGFKAEQVLFHDIDKPKKYDEPLPEKTNQFRYSIETGEVFEDFKVKQKSPF